MYETGNADQDLNKRLEAMIETVKETNKILADNHEVLMSMFVQMSRMYDVLAATAAGANTSGIVNLLDGHEEGIIFSSPPVLREFNGAGGESDEEPTQ